MNWDLLLDKLVDAGTSLLLAIIVFFVGRILVRLILKASRKGRLINKLDKTARSFALSFIKILLYANLIIVVIAILGIPMASVITVLASAGVAVGLALQGSLSNLAGGIMLMIFRPFQVGDLVNAAGVTGTVQEINLFYTVFVTGDNTRVTVPNGSMMNANILDYSSEELRRVDITFTCGRSESPTQIQELMLRVIGQNPMVLSAPEEPFARLSGASNEALEFTVRVWCKNDDYYTVFFNLTQSISEAMAEAGVRGPALRVQNEN